MCVCMSSVLWFAHTPVICFPPVLPLLQQPLSQCDPTSAPRKHCSWSTGSQTQQMANLQGRGLPPLPGQGLPSLLLDPQEWVLEAGWGFHTPGLRHVSILLDLLLSKQKLFSDSTEHKLWMYKTVGSGEKKKVCKWGWCQVCKQCS